MNPFNELSEVNGEQIRRYLKFFRQKKDGYLRAAVGEFQECKADRLSEDMFSREDVEEIIDYLQSALRTQISQDFSNIINMAALNACQLLVDAQEKGVDLSLDTATLENQAVLEAIEKMSLDAMPKNPRRGVGELVSFKEEARAKREETERLESANQRLQEEVASLRSRLDASDRNSRASSAAAAKGVADVESSAQGRVRALEDDLAEAKDELNKKVSETAQFQQMRKMMQSQANNIRDLRRRLARYEPDACKEEDV